MTGDIGDWWRGLREELHDTWVGSKEPQQIVLELEKAYGRLTSDERTAVDPIVVEWVLSNDKSARFEALSLVHQFEIRHALPAVKKLAEGLRNDPDPLAPYERAKALRIVEQLQN